MPAVAKNKLSAKRLPNGGVKLFGYLPVKEDGVWNPRKKVRLWFKDLAKMEVEKSRLETEAQAYLVGGLESTVRVRETRLSAKQIEWCEAAYLGISKDEDIGVYVQAGKLHIGTGAPVKCTDALAAWVAKMEHRRDQDKLSNLTVKDGKNRVKRFLAASPTCKVLTDITANVLNKYVERGGVGSYTQIGDARVLKTWLNYCVKREKWLKVNPMLEVDMRELTSGAKPKHEPKILTPDQCQRLLDAAVAESDGKMVPYIILTTWSFMRPSELERVKPDEFVTMDGDYVVDHHGKKIRSEWRQPVVPSNVAPLLKLHVKAGAVKDRQVVDGVVIEKGGVFFSDNMFTRIRAAAGLLELLEPKGGQERIKKGSNKWTSDVCRHTGMSYLYQKYRSEGMSKDAAAGAVTSQAGNKKKVAFAHYLSRVGSDASKKFYAIKPSTTPAPMADVVPMEATG